MGCPFAQLSPLLVLSCLVLFFQFGVSFLSPKPLLASLQRGRSLAGERGGRGDRSERERERERAFRGVIYRVVLPVCTGTSVSTQCSERQTEWAIGSLFNVRLSSASSEASGRPPRASARLLGAAVLGHATGPTQSACRIYPKCWRLDRNEEKKYVSTHLSHRATRWETKIQGITL